MLIPEKFVLFSFLFPALYAETHYRFKYFFSWLKKREPEIIADIPSRITKGKQLPVLLIIKDADKYSIDLIKIQTFVNNKKIYSQQIKQTINLTYFDKIFFIDTSKLSAGNQFIDVKITYKIKNKIKTCKNDNHRGTKHNSLPFYVSNELLPKIENCVYGETHSHTIFTSDQLEFGASIQSTAELAKAMGLDFFCATDHSYDLDDEENNYLKNNPLLPKWKKLSDEIKSYNESNKNFKIVRGEEASLNNHKNKNIHCLIYNSKKFYPGNGDSGEKWLHPFSELSIEDVLNDADDNSLIFAAHPVEPVPILQRLLIRRDNWYEKDCKNPRLNGLQFANGGPKKYFEKGKNLWVNMLLQGHRLIGLAGNDAHGNFARYRQVSFPFIKMEENYYHLFGVWRTGVYLKSENIGINSILQSIISGNCFLTNGPALKFEAISGKNKFDMGSHCDRIDTININAVSSSEFGKIAKLTVFHGIIGGNSEKIIYQKDYPNTFYEYNLNFGIEQNKMNGYFRCEVETEKNKLALSNPIWYK